MTVAQLKDEATTLGVTVTTKMKKAEIISAIQKAEKAQKRKAKEEGKSAVPRNTGRTREY